jgi:plastocyanin
MSGFPSRIASRRQVSLFVAAFGLLLLSSAPGAAAPQAKPKPKPVTHTVTMDATSFSPATLTIKPGDSVVWINRDMFPHTATSTLAKEKGGFDSGAIAPGKSWKYTPKTVGSFPYICTLHPTMKAAFAVKK